MKTGDREVSDEPDVVQFITLTATVQEMNFTRFNRQAWARLRKLILNC